MDGRLLLLGPDEQPGGQEAPQLRVALIGATDGLTVMELPDAVRRQLIKISKGHRGAAALASAIPGAPDGFERRDYQQAAAAAWLQNAGRGIMSMATGSGKTKTALAAVAEYQASKDEPRPVVVIVPYIHLVDQWEAECREWGYRPIKCYESSADWMPLAWDAVDTYRVLKDEPPLFLTTVKTASMPPFRKLLQAIAASPGSLSLTKYIILARRKPLTSLTTGSRLDSAYRQPPVVGMTRTGPSPRVVPRRHVFSTH